MEYQSVSHQKAFVLQHVVMERESLHVAIRVDHVLNTYACSLKKSYRRLVDTPLSPKFAHRQ